MKAWKKNVLILGIVCLLVGLLVCFAAIHRLWNRSDDPLTALRNQISGLPQNHDGQETGDGPVSHVYIPEGSFSDLHIDVVDARIILLPAGDGHSRVEYTENPDRPLSLSQEGNTLQIFQKSTWRFSLFPLPSTQIRVYLEDRQYAAAIVETTSGAVEFSAGLTFGTVQVKTTSGSITCHAQVMGALELGSTSGKITAENLQTSSLSVKSTSGSIIVCAATVDTDLKLDSTSGKLSVSDVTCGEASLETTSGRLEMTNLLCRGELEAETTSGALRLQACDARNLSLESVSGSIRGSLRTDKQFRTETVSGAVHVPLSSGTGLCEIETISGSIHITVEAAS